MQWLMFSMMCFAPLTGKKEKVKSLMFDYWLWQRVIFKSTVEHAETDGMCEQFPALHLSKVTPWPPDSSAAQSPAHSDLHPSPFFCQNDKVYSFVYFVRLCFWGFLVGSQRGWLGDSSVDLFLGNFLIPVWPKLNVCGNTNKHFSAPLNLKCMHCFHVASDLEPVLSDSAVFKGKKSLKSGPFWIIINSIFK